MSGTVLGTDKYCWFNLSFYTYIVFKAPITLKTFVMELLLIS